MKKFVSRSLYIAKSILMKIVAPYRRNKALSGPKCKNGTERVNLHLGCGKVRLPGFLNVDILDGHAVDICDDIARLEKIADGSVDLIYACHALEHFSHVDAVKVLQRWFEVLKPGGEMRVSVPDIDRIVNIYKRNWKHFQTPGNSPWIGLIYGGQDDPYDFHKTGFNYCWMKHLLENIGFVDVREYAHEPHFVSGARDASMAKEPFGEYLSLNVVCRKP